MKQRSFSLKALNERTGRILNDFAIVIGSVSSESEKFIEGLVAKILSKNKKDVAEADVFLKRALIFSTGSGIRLLKKRIAQYNETALTVLEDRGMLPKEKEPEKDFLEIPGNRAVLMDYCDRLFRELTLYQNELRRAYERYEEVREPVFKINAESISLEELPLILKRLAEAPKRPYLDMTIEDKSGKIREELEETVCFLKKLPGARAPKQPEIITQWIRELYHPIPREV